MVEVDSHLKLLPASILEIYKVFAVYWHAVAAFLNSYTHAHTPRWYLCHLICIVVLVALLLSFLS